MATAVMSNDDVYGAMVYGQPHPQTVQFIQNMVSAPTAALSNIAREFIGRATDMFDRFHGEEAMNRAAQALNKVGGRWDNNNVRPLLTVEDTKNAPLVMQRYLMACPDIRTRYHKMQLDGYSDQYEDINPGLVGEDHYDYRRVMNGMWDGSQWTEYTEDLIEGDRELLFYEQSSIQRSWGTLMSAIWEDDDVDPTSRYL